MVPRFVVAAAGTFSVNAPRSPSDSTSTSIGPDGNSLPISAPSVVL